MRLPDRGSRGPTVVVERHDRRRSEDLTAEENADLCAGCVKCCTHIAVQIDAPRAAWEYDQWIWALHHRGVSLYVERPEKWFLHFATVCEHLNAAGRCAIHGRHPVLCREYDPRSCERRLPLADVVAWFDRGEDLEAWLAKHRPVHHRRLLEHRRDMPQGPPVADARADRRGAASLIPIGEPPAGGPGGSGSSDRRRPPTPAAQESRTRKRA